MGETAEERARRLRYTGGGEIFWRMVQGDTDDYVITIEEVQRGINWIKSNFGKKDVSLVKEYSKGSFKFV